MTPTAASLRIGIFGPEEIAGSESRGCALWATGYEAAITMAGATPVSLGETTDGTPWKEVLSDLDALVWTGRTQPGFPLRLEEERLCNWCRKIRLPLLAVDDALHALNLHFGGTLYLDLPRERPDALQHRHPPEKGIRHAIAVVPGSHLADIYGEGELVVNSEHGRAICRVAAGFRISGQALDGIVETIEAERDDWFALGVQWRPAATSASGLDIQLFRGLTDAAARRGAVSGRSRIACPAAA